MALCIKRCIKQVHPPKVAYTWDPATFFARIENWIQSTGNLRVRTCIHTLIPVSLLRNIEKHRSMSEQIFLNNQTTIKQSSVRPPNIAMLAKLRSQEQMHLDIANLWGVPKGSLKYGEGLLCRFRRTGPDSVESTKNRSLHRGLVTRGLVIVRCIKVMKSHNISWSMRQQHYKHLDFVHSRTSVAVLAEIPLRSPRKLFIFIIKKYIYRIKVSKINLILKKKSLSRT